VSTNLTHWTHLPIAISPDPLGDIWSGSAVVDATNSSGLQTNPDISPIVAIFTQTQGGARQQQSIAYSNDRGRTFTMFPKNPVIPNEGTYAACKVSKDHNTESMGETFLFDLAKNLACCR
jgi:fructan beta-fructosidase